MKAGATTSEGEDSGEFSLERKRNELMQLIEGSSNQQSGQEVNTPGKNTYESDDSSAYLSQDGSFMQGSYMSGEGSYMRGSGGSQSSGIRNTSERDRVVSDGSINRSYESSYEHSEDTSKIQRQPLNDTSSERVRSVSDDSHYKSNGSSTVKSDDTSDISDASQNHDYSTLEFASEERPDMDRFKNLSESNLHVSQSSGNLQSDDDASVAQSIQSATQEIFGTIMQRVKSMETKSEYAEFFDNKSDHSRRRAQRKSSISSLQSHSSHARLIKRGNDYSDFFDDKSDHSDHRPMISSRSSHGRLNRPRGEDYVDFFKCKSDHPSRPVNPLKAAPTLRRRHSFHGRSFDSYSKSKKSETKEKDKAHTKMKRSQSFSGDSGSPPLARPNSPSKQRVPKIPLSIPGGSSERGASWETAPSEGSQTKSSPENQEDNGWNMNPSQNQVASTIDTNEDKKHLTNISNAITSTNQIIEEEKLNSARMVLASVSQQHSTSLQNKPDPPPTATAAPMRRNQPAPSAKDFLSRSMQDNPTPIKHNNSLQNQAGGPPSTKDFLSRSMNLSQEDVLTPIRRNNSLQNQAGVPPRASPVPMSRSSSPQNQADDPEANGPPRSSPVPLKRSSSLQNRANTPPTSTSPIPIKRSGSQQSLPDGAPPRCRSPAPTNRNARAGAPPPSPVPSQRSFRKKVYRKRDSFASTNNSVGTLDSIEHMSQHSGASKYTIDTTEDRLHRSCSQKRRTSMDESRRSRDSSRQGSIRSSVHSSSNNSKHSRHSRMSRRFSQDIEEGVRYKPESQFEKEVQSLLEGKKVKPFDVLATNDEERPVEEIPRTIIPPPQLDNAHSRHSLTSGDMSNGKSQKQNHNFFEDISSDDDRRDDKLEFQRLGKLKNSTINNYKKIRESFRRSNNKNDEETSPKMSKVRSFFSERPSIISLSWKNNDLSPLGQGEERRPMGPGKSIFARMRGDSDDSSSLGDDDLEREWGDEYDTGIPTEQRGILYGKTASTLRSKGWILGLKMQTYCPTLYEYRKYVFIGVLLLAVVLCIAIPLSSSSSDTDGNSSNVAAYNDTSQTPPISSPTMYPTPKVEPFYYLKDDLGNSNRGDEAGQSISMSASGRFLAIGYPQSLTGPGKVQVFELHNGRLVPYGNPIIGGRKNEKFGYSVSISDNGQEVAIGAPNAENNHGYAVVYKFNFALSVWRQIGDRLRFFFYNGHAGTSVSLSGDSRRLAVGIPRAYNYDGVVLIYEFTRNSWNRLTTIRGQYSELMGSAVSLNANGDTIAISAVHSPTPQGPRGRVYILRYDTSWLQIGNPIFDGVDLFGRSVSLSADGNTVAIGATGLDKVSAKGVGMCAVYKYLINDDDEFVKDDWEQSGRNLEGEFVGEHSGYSVVLSNNGRRVGCGAQGGSLVRVYSKGGDDDDNLWQQNAKLLGGPSTSFGAAMAMNNDGTVLAVGAPLDQNKGDVSIYQAVQDVI